jgi:L-amino acid N-acyltransferase YncA
MAQNYLHLLLHLLNSCHCIKQEEAHIHFIGIHPGWREQKIARTLYQEFFGSAKAKGCREVSAVISPINKRSIAFHLKMGFSPKNASHKIDDIFVFKDYDGVGEDRVLFEKEI